MTTLWANDSDARPAPRVANLDARESDRAGEWKEKMRAMAIQDAPPEPSIVERLTVRWYRVCAWWDRTAAEPSFWPTLFWTGLVALAVAALIVKR